MEKRLYRSPTDKVVGGVCGGLAEYFNIDPSLVRVVAAVLMLFSHGFGFVAYIAAWIIIPKRDPEIAVGFDRPAAEAPTPEWKKFLPGIILISIGLLLLVRDFWFWFDWEDFWPVFLIIVGLFLIFRRNPCEEKSHEQVGSNNSNNGPKTENGGSLS